MKSKNKAVIFKTLLVLAAILFGIQGGLLLSEYLTGGSFENWIFPVGNMIVMTMVMIYSFFEWKRYYKLFNTNESKNE